MQINSNHFNVNDSRRLTIGVIGCRDMYVYFTFFQQALKLMSRPLTLWVRAPMEMKSTPASP